MKNKFRFIGAVLCGAVIGWSACWYAVYRPQPCQPVGEAKICYYNLETHSDTMAPQLREYMKARLYSVSASHIGEGWLDDWEIDFGPVDQSVLGPIYAIKNASSLESVYEAALSRHPESAVINQKAKGSLSGLENQGGG